MDVVDPYADDVAAVMAVLPQRVERQAHPEEDAPGVDDELMEWVRDFIQGRERVTVDEIQREFFPDESDNPYSYLEALIADGLITHRKTDQVYEWAYKGETSQKKIRIYHGNCRHANTPWARELCRREQGYGPDPDFRDKQRRGRWGQFVDGQVHELTTEQIQELTTPSTTPARFERRLRAHASNYGLTCSVQQAENGLRFCLAGSADLTSMAAYLPREVAERDIQDVKARVGVRHSSHVNCTHPKTRNERDKCRRAQRAASRVA